MNSAAAQSERRGPTLVDRRTIYGIIGATMNYHLFMNLDPITAETAAQLIADALRSVAGNLYIRQNEKSDSRIITEVRDARRVATRVNMAVAANRLLEAHQHAGLRTYLGSIEASNIARQLCAAVFLEQCATYVPSILDELTLSLTLTLEIDQGQASDIANVVVETLVDEFQSAKDRIAKHSQAPVQAWHELILSHLNNIDRLLECLASKRSTDVREMNAFAEMLRDQVRQRHRHIVPPNISDARRVPIDAIYVPPQLTAMARKGHQTRQATEQESRPGSHIATLEEMTSGLYRTTVLGSPGAGKSTMAAKLCYEISGRSDTFRIAGKHPVPIPVVLRDFSAARKEDDLSIRDYIVNYASKRLQLDVPVGAIEYLLLTGSILIVFDGLDELLDTTFRRAVVQDVESFSHHYAAAPILITSRIVGYGNAPVDDDIFATWLLDDFDYPRVESYARKWFALDTDLSRDEQSNAADAFMNESEHIWDLRSNPLMLALLCNMYRGEQYLPQHRPEVYARCSTMLFERWDRSRGINVPLSFEPNLAGALMAIAYWIYSEDTLQSGVTERALIDKAAKYLHKRRFRKIEDARAAALDFVTYCRGRAWVLTDTGTTAAGEPLYQFTHRTFLEYFAACHLVRIYMTPRRLWRALEGRVAAGEWEVTASLAVQLLNQNVEDGADALLRLLLSSASEATLESQVGMLGFASRCLNFIVPSPEMTASVTDIIFAVTVELWSGRETRALTRFVTYGILETLSHLVYNAANENSDVILERLESALIDAVAMRGSTRLPVQVRVPLVYLRGYLRVHDEDDRWLALAGQLGDFMRNPDVERFLARVEKLLLQWERGLVSFNELVDELNEIIARYSLVELST
jgi:hypothetical protein